MKNFILLFCLFITCKAFAATPFLEEPAVIRDSTEQHITSTEDNPLLYYAFRYLATSYIKKQVRRYTRKYITNRFGRMAANQAASYAVDEAFDQVERKLSYSEKQHISSHWSSGTTDEAHFSRCRVCNRTGQQLVEAASYRSNSYSSQSRNRLRVYNGLRLNLSLSIPRTDEVFHTSVIENGAAFAGGSFSLEYQVGVLQFETGYKYFETKYEQFNIEKYKLSGIYGLGSLTYPGLKIIAPSVGGGYFINRVDYLRDNDNVRYDNNGILLQGALSINPSRKWSIQGRYNRLIQQDAFETEYLEVGLKFRLR